MLTDKVGAVWLDGNWCSGAEASVSLLSHTLHYGLGIFEGIRAYETAKGTAIFRLQAHTQRFFDSAKIMNMTLPISLSALDEACLAVLKKNSLQSAYIRPIAFYGGETLHLDPAPCKVHVAVAAWDWGSYLGAENLEKGIRLGTSSFTRHHVNVTMCRAKTCGHYVNSILALQEARANGYDEALFLDAQGYVSEATGQNLFVVCDDKLYTPMVTSGLCGITRDAVLQFAADMQLEVCEKLITRDVIYTASEVFLTGTASEVMPVTSLDNRVIGDGRRGPITTKIQQAYFEYARGQYEDKYGWLTYVD